MRRSATDQRLFEAIRTAVADYIASEGCSCCRGDQHDEHRAILARLLGVPPHPEQADYFPFDRFQSK